MKHICWHSHADILCALYYQVHRYLEVQFPRDLSLIHYVLGMFAFINMNTKYNFVPNSYFRV